MFSKALVLFEIAIILLQFSNTTGLSIEVPSECKTEEICYKKPVGFPSEEIDEIIKERQGKSNFTSFIQREYYDEDFEEPAPNDLNCYIRAEIKTPYLVTVKGTWKPVVQSQYFSQKIREVKCDDEGKPCMNLDGYFDTRKKTATCVTKTAAILIQFYDPLETDNKIKQINKDVAVCCTCNIKESE